MNDVTSSDSTQATRGVVRVDGKLIDIVLPKWFMARARYLILWMLLVTSLTLGPVLLVVLVIPSTQVLYLSLLVVSGPLVAMSVMLVPAFIVARRGRRLSRQIETQLHGDADASVGDLFEALDWTGMDLRIAHPLLNGIARALVRHGRPGYVLRVTEYSDDLPETCRPIDVPFEPVPLTEDDPQWAELASMIEDDDVGPEHRAEPTRGRRKKRRLPSEISPRMRKVLGVGCAATAVLFITGAAFSRDPGMLALAAFAAQGTLLFYSWGPRSKWWAFPGGVAVPPRTSSGPWRLMTPDNAVLVVFPAFVTIHSTHEKGHISKIMTRRESSLAISAWYSTAGTLSEEQIQAAFA